MKFFILFFTFLFYSSLTYSQYTPPIYCDEEPNNSLLEDYWASREIFNNNFIVNGSINENGDLIDDGIGIFDETTNRYTYAGHGLPAGKLEMRQNGDNWLRWYDSGVELGKWIATLCTEYKLLGDNNQPELQKRALNELFLALQAYRRLDMTAQKLMEVLQEHYGIPPSEYPSECSDYLTGYTGFFLRDDAGYSILNNFTSSDPTWNTSNIVSDFSNEIVNFPDKYFEDNVVSQDQVIGILFGLAFVRKYIPGSVNVTVNGQSYNIRQMATNIACGMVTRIVENPNLWITYPDMGNCQQDDATVPRGYSCKWFINGMIRAANRVGCNIPEEGELKWQLAAEAILNLVSNPSQNIPGDNPDNIRMMLELMAAAGGDEYFNIPTPYYQTFLLQEFAYSLLYIDAGPFGNVPPAPAPASETMENILCRYDCPGPCYMSDQYEATITDNDPDNDWGPDFGCDSDNLWIRDRWKSNRGVSITARYSPLSYMLAFNLYQLSGSASNPNYYNPYNYELNYNIETSPYDGVVVIDGPDGVCSAGEFSYEIVDEDGSCWEWTVSNNLEILSIVDGVVTLRALTNNTDTWIECVEICGEFDECNLPRKVRKNLSIKDLCTFDCLRDGDIHIYDDQVIDTDMGLRFANIYVHSGAQLTITSTIHFIHEYGIVVERGGKLHLKGGTLTRCNSPDPTPNVGIHSQDWRGINVEGNNSQVQPNPMSSPSGNESGIVLLTDGARIEWARNAISTTKIGESWNSAYWGAVVVGDGATFYNCHRSVEFMKYDRPNQSRFSNCTFEGDGEGDVAIGVSIWDTDGITFTNCSFNGMSDACIRTWDAGCTVTSNSIFSNSDRGVEIFATSPTSSGDPVVINAGCVFNLNRYDVYSSAKGLYKELSITGNIFNNAALDAIHLRGLTSSTINENAFNNVEYGIACSSTGNGFNDFYCNDFNTATAEGSIGVLLDGQNSRTEITKNEFNTSFIDLAIVGSDAEPGEVNPIQGSIDAPAENCFSNAHNEHIGTFTSIKFDYYNPNGNSGCLDPQSGMFGDNNYDEKISSGPIVDDCPDNIIINCPPDYSSYTAIKSQHDNLVGQLDANPDNATLLQQTLETEEEKEKIIDCFVKDALVTGNIQTAATVLNNEGTTKAMKKLYGLKLQTNDYVGANTTLHALPTDSEDDLLFVQIQEINLARLQNTNADFVLNASQDAILLNAANQPDLPSSNYAMALLSILKGLKFDHTHPPLSGDYIPQDLIRTNNVVSDILLQPNPTTGNVKLSLPGHSEGGVTTMIFDLKGRLIKSFQLDEGIRFELDLHGLAPGMYLIKVSDEKKTFGQKKLVITK